MYLKKVFEVVVLFLIAIVYYPVRFVLRTGLYVAGSLVLIYAFVLLTTPALDKQVDKDQERRIEWYEEFRAKVDEPLFPEFE